MPPKPDLVFHTAPIAVETDHSAFTVLLSPSKPTRDLSHINSPSVPNRPSAPIIEDWVSDSEDESEPNDLQSVPSFVQSSEQVKTPRHSVQPIKARILDVTPKPASPKSNNISKRKTRKTCFVCKSVEHLIKDCNYHAKKKGQPTPRNYAHRGYNKQHASFTHKHPPKHMVPVTVLTQSKPVLLLLLDHPSPKTNNSPPRVTAAQVPVVSAAKGADTVVSGDDVQDQSIPSPTPLTPPPQPPQDIPSTYQEALDACVALTRRVEHLEHDKVAQDLEIIKLKTRVKKLERANKVKALKLRRLRKVRTSQRVDTSDDTIIEDVSNQERMIDELDKDESVALMGEKEEEKKAEEVKDIAEINQDIDWDVAIDHVKQKAKEDKLDNFKGMSYDDIHPIFKAKFNSNIEFLLRSKEKIKEEENRAIESINETPAQKAAKRRKMNEDVKDLKHLEIVPDEDDDVYTEATPIARKVPVLDYQIVHFNNKAHYKIILADGTHQLYEMMYKINLFRHLLQLLHHHNHLKIFHPDPKVDTSDDTITEDVSNQGRMIDELDRDEGVALIGEKEEEKKAKEVKDSAGDAQDIDWDVAIDHVKQIAKEDKSVQRYQVMKKRPQTEAQAQRNMIMYLKNTAGFRLYY
nr:hypothetical protein [Tanacetum cinerariifolium]